MPENSQSEGESADHEGPTSQRTLSSASATSDGDSEDASYDADDDDSYKLYSRVSLRPRLRSSPHRHAPLRLLSRNPAARLTGATTCFRQDAGIPERAGVGVCLDLGVVLRINTQKVSTRGKVEK